MKPNQNTNNRQQQSIKDMEDHYKWLEKDKFKSQNSFSTKWSSKFEVGVKKGELPEQEVNDVTGRHNNLSQPFLMMLQKDEVADASEINRNFGTNSTKAPLKSKSQDSVTHLVMEFQGIGESDVQVSQAEDSYKVVINVRDKSKIPSNPILFKKIIEKQLSQNLGVPIFVEVR